MWIRHIVFATIMVLIMLIIGIYAYQVSSQAAVMGGKSTEIGTRTSLDTVVLSQLKAYFAEEVLQAKNALMTIVPNQQNAGLGVTSLQNKTGKLKLLEGTGIDIDGLRITNTDPGTAQHIFGNVVVGDISLAASSNADALTLLAGTGVSLDADDVTKRITISATTTASSIFDTLTVGNNSAVTIDNKGRLAVSYNGDAGFLSSTGGALYLNNSNNTGTALGIYSNAGADALGNMINVKVDNAAYAQAAFYMNYDGNSNAVEIVSNSTDSSSNALSVIGNNINDSTLGIIGNELSNGTIKVTHYRPTGGTDSNAAALSIDLKGSGTRAQGVYVDSTESGGTIGNLLRLRNTSIDKFVVDYQGNVTLSGNIIQGSYGTDTSWTKYGNTTGDQFFVGTNGSFRMQRAASNSEAFRVQINGDTQGRWKGTSDGSLQWGDGSSAQDTVLRRGASGMLWLTGGIVLNNGNGSYNTVVKGVTDSNLLYVNAATNSIGIGTANPHAALHIEKNAQGNAALLINQQGSGRILAASAAGSTVFTLDTSGNVRTIGSLCVKATISSTCAGATPGTIYASNTTVQAADLAENYISSQELASGDVVMVAEDTNTQSVVRTTAPYQKQVLGVVSTKPGVTLNADAQTDTEHPYLYPIALQGRVYIKVSTQNGPIAKGDNLTSSSQASVAMKATGNGPIVAKALESYTQANEGKIMAFMSLSYHNDVQSQQQTTTSGTVTLTAGATEVTVQTGATEEKTLFIQPEDTPIVTAVSKKTPDTFVIKTNVPQPHDITLHWMLVSKQ